MAIVDDPFESVYSALLARGFRLIPPYPSSASPPAFLPSPREPARVLQLSPSLPREGTPPNSNSPTAMDVEELPSPPSPHQVLNTRALPPPSWSWSQYHRNIVGGGIVNPLYIGFRGSHRGSGVFNGTTLLLDNGFPTLSALRVSPSYRRSLLGELRNSVTTCGYGGDQAWVTLLRVGSAAEIEMANSVMLSLAATSHRNLHNIQDACSVATPKGEYILCVVSDAFPSPTPVRQHLALSRGVKPLPRSPIPMQLCGADSDADSCCHPQPMAIDGPPRNCTTPSDDSEDESIDEDMEAAYSLLGLCNAVRFLHDELKLVHGSICMDSVLIGEDSVLKLSHLWATCSSSLQYLLASTSSYAVAPEVYSGKSSFTTASDVWSLGVFFLEYLALVSSCAATPLIHVDCNIALDKVVQSSGRSLKWGEIIRPMLNPIPAARPSALAVLQTLISQFLSIHQVSSFFPRIHFPVPDEPSQDEEDLKLWLHLIEVDPFHALSQIRSALQKNPDCVLAMMLLRRLYSRHPATMEDLLPVGSCPKEALLQRALRAPRHWQIRAKEALDAHWIHAKTPSCLFFLALCLKHGIGTGKSDSDAADYYALASALGNAEACCNLGVCYRNGVAAGGNSMEEKLAARMYRLGSELGNAEARRNLAWCYSTGTGVRKSIKNAVKHYRIAALYQNNAAALCNLGWCHLQGCGVIRNEKDAVKMYKLAVEQGHALAQFNLGWCFAGGIGTEQDEFEAVRLYRLAASQGDLFFYFSLKQVGLADAQCSLGWCLINGTGVTQDCHEGARLFRLAVEMEEPLAQYSLGWCFYHGQGVPQDFVEAARLFRLASEKGNVLALYSYAVCHYYGIGAVKDSKEASRLFRFAADKGYKDAQTILAQMSNPTPPL